MLFINSFPVTSIFLVAYHKNLQSLCKFSSVEKIRYIDLSAKYKNILPHRTEMFEIEILKL